MGLATRRQGGPTRRSLGTRLDHLSNESHWAETDDEDSDFYNSDYEEEELE